MRITDMKLTIPGLPLLLVLSTVWKFGSAVEMGLVLGLLGWGGVARAVRAQTLSLRERGFIEAARGLGLSTRHIIGKELLPSMAPYIAMNMLIAVTGAVYAQVGLFFLGVLPLRGEQLGRDAQPRRVRRRRADHHRRAAVPAGAAAGDPAAHPGHRARGRRHGRDLQPRLREE